ncbi:NADH dehydrogenase [ubiquinone] 1 alpha subcomplex subunit 9, mitochondrial-like [Eurytemora carolleeae]|uniref:NADH dehydrogenase [ubiquinone] 1 alpha subcomplex subunit 9, mitochondrial-like n=1 Tax=Eurytemora carolleeae TaxID=1294199 RepID=UPI000C77BC4A|nr:NADH dehydrogenase [ubiquinone] 1 alpha subcomplex subunit 9, mitochondrial-like [Eurytemora carolleeae]XP_023331841.1 NADH dehydrogenase [ubiquinone] 1 alpha subcomplex subunit 9, mitochondrial-like [Eurytemora carolleeae]|eukprot:XP_023331840.1 NADH dehydrogenase [ubiquinone] 1 alpha subcomplex subunit 9, mitochondrial-like [Eurytemora affinis]
MAGLSMRSGIPLLKLPAGTMAPSSQFLAQSYSSEVKARDINLAAMKRGRGGRSSFSGDVVTVFGGNGFIGRGVANRLGKNGSQMIFPYRGDHYKMMRLKVVGDLGQVLFCPFELKDEESIRNAVKHSNIVINLIGRDMETRNFSYTDVNVNGPETIARICKEMGVQRLVHMSSINARAEPERAFLSRGSEWLRTKYAGELAVRDQFPDATIFRCSDVYGQQDNFINRIFSILTRNGFHGIPLYLKGNYTVKQPVHMSDVVTGIMNSLYDPEAIGQTYEAVGPERITMNELVRYMYECTSRTPEAWNFHITELMLDPTAFIKAYMTSKSPFGGVEAFYQQSLDTLERMSISDESEGYPDLTHLGVKLSTLQQRMPWELKARDLFSYYEYETVEEVPIVKPPKILSFHEERDLKNRGAAGLLNIIPGIN